jgi:fructoselysine-6-P-deglycase FrlB-like protein
VRAIDPLELAKNPRLGAKKSVYFVSVSGRTTSNIAAAKNTNSTAITKNVTSPLARTCKKTIPLHYKDAGVQTAGTVGFLASAIACLSLVNKIKIKNAVGLYLRAKKLSQIKLSHSVFFLGNQHTYPVAIYAAAKLYEVMGYTAHYSKTEQFSHMELFCTKPRDSIILFEEKNRHNARLASNLKKLGLNVYIPSAGTGDKISQVIFYVFFSQHLALYNARQRRLRNCYFVTRKKIRNASSHMIY